MTIGPVTFNASYDIVSRLMRRSIESTRTSPASSDAFASLSTRNAAAETPLGRTARGVTARFAGFDFGRAQDPSRSAKDAFAHVASAVGMMPRTKAEAEQWFNTLIKPEMERLGHQIDWVRGDKFQFTNWQGTFVVDFVVGADGPDPALAWQVE